MYKSNIYTEDLRERNYRSASYKHSHIVEIRKGIGQRLLSRPAFH